MQDDYNIKDEKIFKAYEADKKNNTKGTKKEYAKVLTKFCRSVGKTLNMIVDEVKLEQSTKVEEIISQDGNKTTSRVTYFDVNGPDSTIKKYLDDFENYCLEKGNKNTTTNKNIQHVRTFLKSQNIELPKWEKLPDDTAEWHLLNKEDIKFVLDECTILHKSLITFLISSGMRIGDCVELTIGDFMDATRAYHDYVDVEDFIDNAPQDMMGFWSFEPGKTKKHDISCKTFNSPESSNLILQNLRRLKNEYYPKKSKRIKKELKISKNDALFGSRNSLYKGHMKASSVSNMLPSKDKKLKEWKIKKIKEDIESGKISAEDYDKKVAEIPKFHAHACRKYFETMISRNCGDLRICTLMEGHASPVKTDKSYIKKEFDEVQEIYLQALEDLTIENVDSKLLSNKKISELESTIENLKADQAQKDELLKQREEENKQQATEIKNLKENQSNQNNSINDLSDRLKEMDKQLNHLNNNEPENTEIKSIVNSYLWSLTKKRISNNITADDLLNNIDADINDEFENMTPEELENWDLESENFLSKINEYEIFDELQPNENTFSLNDEEIDELYNSKLGKQLRTFNQDEILTIQELTYEIASNEINFEPTTQNLFKIIKKAIFKMKRNPDLIIKVTNYHEDLYHKIHRHTEIFDLLDKKIDELELWDVEEATILKSKIIAEVMQRRQYTKQEVTEDIVMDLIEKYM